MENRPPVSSQESQQTIEKVLSALEMKKRDAFHEVEKLFQQKIAVAPEPTTFISNGRVFELREGKENDMTFALAQRDLRIAEVLHSEAVKEGEPFKESVLAKLVEYLKIRLEGFKYRFELEEIGGVSLDEVLKKDGSSTDKVGGDERFIVH